MIAPTCRVTVTRPGTGRRDALGVPVRGDAEATEVDGVLVDLPSGTEAQAAGTGVDRAAQSALDLHFPKGYDGRLLGCTVEIPGTAPWAGAWQVVGDPMPYPGRHCPGRWNRRVRVVRPDA